ncbi:hypothetical protein APS67_004788 [Streptomyces sp. AVP053U2]|nr:hypothetical protein APS67_004788 [Streptomyces sp. AVP053U2]
MLNMTPEAYIQVRSTNGISWARSGVLLPRRAKISARPVLKTNWSSSAGTTSSQDRAGMLPNAITTTTRTIIENSSCWSCCSANETGSAARGKCRARTRPRLPEMARTPARTELCVNVNTNTPVTRNGT